MTDPSPTNAYEDAEIARVEAAAREGAFYALIHAPSPGEVTVFPFRLEPTGVAA